MLKVCTWTSHHLATRKCPNSWMKMTKPSPRTALDRAHRSLPSQYDSNTTARIPKQASMGMLSRSQGPSAFSRGGSGSGADEGELFNADSRGSRVSNEL